METPITEMCEKIASINGKSKLDVYRSAFKLFGDCLSKGVPSNFSLTALAVKNIQLDLASREEAVKTAASHLFLTLVQLSITLSSAVATRSDSWTFPIQNFLADTKSIVQFCFPLLGSKQQQSQRESLCVVRSCLQGIREWGEPSNEEAQTILTNLIEMRILPRLEEMLGDPEQQEVLAMEIWQQLIHSIGNYIPTTNHELINRLLKLIEFCFKSNHSDVQRCAYTSWSILIRTFSLHPTFLVKKLRLFNVPLLSCAVKQDHRYVLVDVERAKTWCQLITSLASDLQDHSNSLLSPFFFFCIGMDPKLTQSEKFNETFISHFSSIWKGELDGIQMTDLPGIVPATQDDVTIIQRTLGQIENSGEFLAFLSKLSGKQHLPKKAISDPSILNEWREQLAILGIQALAAFLNVGPLQSPQAGLYADLKVQLSSVMTSSEYIVARNTWVVANYRLLLVLIGVCVQLSGPIHGEMIGSCFRRVLQIVTSSQTMIDRTQMLYPALALAHTAVLKKQYIPTIIKIISSTHESIPEQLCIPLSSNQRQATIAARFFIEILLDPHLLTSDQALPDSYFDLYQQLLYSRNIKSWTLTDYKHYLSKFDSACYDVTNTWRGWKISAEAFLEVIQATNHINEGTSSCPDFSSCSYILSFPVTQCTEPPDSSSLVRDSADVWKVLSSHVLKLIAELSHAESNMFVASICQSIVSLPKLQLRSPLHLLFTTQILDNLVDHINFQYSAVFPELGNHISPLSPPITPLVQSRDAPMRDRALGNISQTIQALSKLLVLTFASETASSPYDDLNTIESASIEGLADSRAVTNVLMTTIQVFSHLDTPFIIQNVLVHLSDPISSYFTLTYSESIGDSSRDVDTFHCLVARLWDVIKTSILTCSKFDTSLLQTISPILLPLFGARDQSIQASVCDFFSRSFSISTEKVDYPASLQPIILSLQERGLLQLPPSDSTCSSRKSQVHKLESREDPPTNSAKRVKISSSDASPLYSPDLSELILVSSNDTELEALDIPIIPMGDSLPSEEDPLPVVESVVSLFDGKSIDLSMDTVDTPTRPVAMTPDLTGNDNMTTFSKPPFKFYSERKQGNKPVKFQKSGESKLSSTHTPGDKEKRPFFKLELTPLKLDDIRSSPTHHHSVNRKLQFSKEDQLALDQLCEAETLSLSQAEIPAFNLDSSSSTQPTHYAVQPQPDSIEEFLQGIPLDAIISPDDVNSINFEDKIPDHDDVIVSDDTNSLISLTSTSVSQSVTPPDAPVDVFSEREEQVNSPDLDSGANPEPVCQEEPIAVSMCLMEVELAGDNPGQTVRDMHNDSIEEHNLISSTLSKITSPEVTTVSSTTQPFTTPTHSILKKQPIICSPSPNIKKVSFADPLEERHSIAISPRNRKLRSQKRASSSKLATNSISPLTRSAKTSSASPIFPLLQDCNEPVTTLIPALTSQAVSRGIVGLLKAKNIETVGDLAMLSEGVAENLPIQPPKLDTLRMAFTKFQSTQLGIELTRQSTNPLVFPQEQVVFVEDDLAEKEREEEVVVPTEVVELQDIESAGEIIAVDFVPLREDSISLETISTQTDSIPLLSQLSDLSTTLDDELLTLSQQELIQLHSSLCHMLPSIADKFKFNI